jgi:propionyl-CoA carboxylase alpha chain
VSNWFIGNPLLTALINDQKVNVKIEKVRTGYRLTHSGIIVDVFVRSPRISELEALMSVRDDKVDQTELLAPLSGQIVAINVKEGDMVEAGQEVMVLTAMKMENLLTVERSAKIVKILVKEKENVTTGQVMMEFEY